LPTFELVVVIAQRREEGSRFTVQLPALAAEVQTLRTDTECDMSTRGPTFS